MFRKLTTKEEVEAAFRSEMLWVAFGQSGTDMRQIKRTISSTTPEKYADSWNALRGAPGGWWECYILVEDADDEEG